MSRPDALPSRRPYLIRAIYEWCVDSGYTPHLLVAADYPGVVVPKQYVRDARITLNISPVAVQSLDLKSEPAWFSARFGGKPMDVQVPTGAVLAIFAQENGEGVIFGETEEPTTTETTAPSATEAPPPPERPRPAGGGRSHLRVVK